jgi:hypothetical protein
VAQPFVAERDQSSQTFSLAWDDNPAAELLSAAEVLLLTDCCEYAGLP